MTEHRWPVARVEWVDYADAHPENQADVFIQWKGTDVCFDFTCQCGEGGHYDGYFAYCIKCKACGSEYVFPATIYPAAPDPGGWQHTPIVIETEENEWGGPPVYDAEPEDLRRTLMERLAVILTSPEAAQLGVTSLTFKSPAGSEGRAFYRPDDKRQRIDGVTKGQPFDEWSGPIELGGKGYERHDG